MSGDVGSRGRTRQGRASLRDVAALAGVSIATASRVLSGSEHPVGTQTRDRVLDSADRLAFVPNQVARSLVTARSQIVGAIVHDISDPYFGDIVRGLEDCLNPFDYRLLVASSDRDPKKEIQYVRAFIGQQVDGIVLSASGLGDVQYQEELIELVISYRRRGGAIAVLSEHVVTGPRVVFDNRQSSREMVGYLVAKGHRRIAYLNGHSGLMISEIRYGGYLDGLSDAGIAYDPDLVVDGEFTIEGGRAATLDLLDRSDFTAVFASNDLMAFGSIRALRDRGVAVPEDVSVAGFDDILMAEYALVPLTTVRMPTHDIGLRGASLILAQLQGESPADEHVKGEIIERSSVISPTHT